MGKRLGFTLHEIAVDGLPDMDNLTGRVAFIFDGCVVSGWPLSRGRLSERDRQTLGSQTAWEGDSDVSHGRPFGNVTHWIEFDAPVWHLANP